MLKALVDVLLSSYMLAIAIWKSRYRHLGIGIGIGIGIEKILFLPTKCFMKKKTFM